MINLPSLITLPFAHENTVAADDSAEDKYPESIPRMLIQRLSKKGDKVFDPFLGHGTSAFEAEALERIPYGVEADGGRYEWAAGQCEYWQNIFHADAADIPALGLPKMDLCVSSPPFMARHHKWNPLAGGDPDFSGYGTYLQMLSDIFAGVKTIMKRGSLVCVHVENVQIGKVFTPLVRDFSFCLSESFVPVGESIIKWEGRDTNEPQHSHVLIFKNSQ